MPTRWHENAPAKLNLSLIIAGRMADGYHHLSSLVAFAPDIADRIEIIKTPDCEISGQFSDELPKAAQDNLAWRALKFFADDYSPARQFGIRLIKNLPVGAGLGSGSADAAAVLRLLTQHFPDVWTASQRHARLQELGADVPACFDSSFLSMTGRGDVIQLVSIKFNLWAVLVLPPFRLMTAEVYRALNAPVFQSPPVCAPSAFADLESLIGWLQNQPNELTEIAIKLRPQLADVLAHIKRHAPRALLVRMSGSGTACFALFALEQDARDAVQNLARHLPQCWVRMSRLR